MHKLTWNYDIFNEQNDDEALEFLGEIFGVKIDGISQYGKTNATYAITLASGQEIVIGSARKLIKSCNATRGRIFEHCDVIMEPVSQKNWQTICRFIGRIKKVLPARDVYNARVITGLLKSYIAHLRTLPDWGKMVYMWPKSFEDVMDVFINEHDFTQWMASEEINPWENHCLSAAMIKIGFVKQTLQRNDPETGKRIGRCWWVMSLSKFKVAEWRM